MDNFRFALLHEGSMDAKRLEKKMEPKVHWNLKGCHSQETKP
jgi:hypothetical protein